MHESTALCLNFHSHLSYLSSNDMLLDVERDMIQSIVYFKKSYRYQFIQNKTKNYGQYLFEQIKCPQHCTIYNKQEELDLTTPRLGEANIVESISNIMHMSMQQDLIKFYHQCLISLPATTWIIVIITITTSLDGKDLLPLRPK